MSSPSLLKEKVDFMTCCPPLIRIPMVRHILFFPLLLVLQLCRAVLHSIQLALFSPAFYLGICFREGSVSPFALGLSGWFLLILHISPWWPPPLWHPRVQLNCPPYLFLYCMAGTTWLGSLFAWLSVRTPTQMVSSRRAWRAILALMDSTASAMESPRCMLALTRKLKTCFWNPRISISIALIICAAPLADGALPRELQRHSDCGKWNGFQSIYQMRSPGS